MSLYLCMAVLYHSSCMAPSLVKIAKPGEHPPAVGTFHRGRGVQKRPGFGRGRGRVPGRTMLLIGTSFALVTRNYNLKREKTIVILDPISKDMRSHVKSFTKMKKFASRSKCLILMLKSTSHIIRTSTY